MFKSFRLLGLLFLAVPFFPAGFALAQEEPASAEAAFTEDDPVESIATEIPDVAPSSSTSAAGDAGDEPDVPDDIALESVASADDGIAAFPDDPLAEENEDDSSASLGASLSRIVDSAEKKASERAAPQSRTQQASPKKVVAKTASSRQSALCPNCETAGTAEKGTVPEVSIKYKDIYARQIDYKKSAKEFRASLVARQESYERPRREALELYRQNLDAIYKDETQQYQEQLAREAEEAERAREAQQAGEAVIKNKSAQQGGVPAPELSEDGVDHTAAGESEHGVKEKVIEPTEDEETPVKKKIIMPDDAPEFEQSPF